MEVYQQIEFNKQRTTSEIFSDFWLFLKSEWKTYGVMLAVFILPFMLIGSYFVLQQNIDIVQTENIDGLSYANMYMGLLFSFFAKFLGMFISCAYVMAYIQGDKVSFKTIKDFCISNFVTALLASVFMTAFLFVGFCLFLLPGLLLMPPLSYLLYDVLYAKQSCWSSFSRCIALCRTNRKQTYGVVYGCYLAVIVLSMIVDLIVPISGNMLNLVVSSVLSVVSEMMMVPFILLYYSLANQNMQL